MEATIYHTTQVLLNLEKPSADTLCGVKQSIIVLE